MTISIREHPRAQRGVRRARAGAGLVAFLVAALLAHGAGLPGFDVLVRALVAGVVAHAVARGPGRRVLARGDPRRARS